MRQGTRRFWSLVYGTLALFIVLLFAEQAAAARRYDRQHRIHHRHSGHHDSHLVRYRRGRHRHFHRRRHRHRHFHRRRHFHRSRSRFFLGFNFRSGFPYGPYYSQPYYRPYNSRPYSPGVHRRFPAFRHPAFFHHPGSLGKGERAVQPPGPKEQGIEERQPSRPAEIRLKPQGADVQL